MIIAPPALDLRQRRRARVCHAFGVLGLVLVGMGTPLQGLLFLGILMGGADTHVADETLGRLLAEWCGASLGLGLVLVASIWLVSRPRRPVDAATMRLMLALGLVGLAAIAAGEVLMARTAAGAEQAKGATSVAPSTSCADVSYPPGYVPPCCPPVYCIPPDGSPVVPARPAPRTVSLTRER